MTVMQNTWDHFKKTVRGVDTPHQLSLGTALGLMAGMIPLDSLLPYLILVTCILAGGNLVCFSLSGVIGYLLGPSFDGTTHAIGQGLLTHEILEPLFTTMAELPLVPWTRFNNTVVAGSLAMGMLMAIPIYLATQWLSRRWHQAARKNHQSIATEMPLDTATT